MIRARPTPNPAATARAAPWADGPVTAAITRPARMGGAAFATSSGPVAASGKSPTAIPTARHTSTTTSAVPSVPTAPCPTRARRSRPMASAPKGSDHVGAASLAWAEANGSRSSPAKVTSASDSAGNSRHGQLPAAAGPRRLRQRKRAEADRRPDQKVPRRRRQRSHQQGEPHQCQHARLQGGNVLGAGGAQQRPAQARDGVDLLHRDSPARESDEYEPDLRQNGRQRPPEHCHGQPQGSRPGHAPGGHPLFREARADRVGQQETHEPAGRIPQRKRRQHSVLRALPAEGWKPLQPDTAHHQQRGGQQEFRQGGKGGGQGSRRRPSTLLQSCTRAGSTCATWPTGIASTTSASPVRMAAALAVPSGTNCTSKPSASASSPQYPSNRSSLAEEVPSTETNRKEPVPALTGLTTPPSLYAEAARMASCGLDRRWGRRGSGVAVLMTAAAGPSARAVSSTPSRILGLGLAFAAAATSAEVMAARHGTAPPRAD